MYDAELLRVSKAHNEAVNIANNLHDANDQLVRDFYNVWKEGDQLKNELKEKNEIIANQRKMILAYQKQEDEYLVCKHKTYSRKELDEAFILILNENKELEKDSKYKTRRLRELEETNCILKEECEFANKIKEAALTQQFCQLSKLNQQSNDGWKKASDENKELKEQIGFLKHFCDQRGEIINDFKEEYNKLRDEAYKDKSTLESALEEQNEIIQKLNDRIQELTLPREFTQEEKDAVIQANSLVLAHNNPVRLEHMNGMFETTIGPGIPIIKITDSDDEVLEYCYEHHEAYNANKRACDKCKYIEYCDENDIDPDSLEKCRSCGDDFTPELDPDFPELEIICGDCYEIANQLEL